VSVSVRTLNAADAIAVRRLRLEGLRLAPSSFGNSWEEESPQPLSWWENRLRGPAHWIGAESDRALVGMVVVSLNRAMKLAHNAEIGAVYVAERFRRQGVANVMMQSAIAYLRSVKAKNVTLHVSADNIAAQKLYAQFGFSVCGQLRRELNVDGSFNDELLMRTQIF
jgi:ribosomal protein S18 acetylase RimI-like enzyme